LDARYVREHASDVGDVAVREKHVLQICEIVERVALEDLNVVLFQQPVGGQCKF
jgi:hypothetical protein